MIFLFGVFLHWLSPLLTPVTTPRYSSLFGKNSLLWYCFVSLSQLIFTSNSRVSSRLLWQDLQTIRPRLRVLQSTRSFFRCIRIHYSLKICRCTISPRERCICKQSSSAIFEGSSDSQFQLY
ncbi:unnamed protein product [Moneuplotes crassus]|uniref:Secreted protein n=1 Tax=Euplotes crassus TaxID=5936 RepID=A0AAD1Y7Q2_EUPCR|nr:unnamed protein product [Moneuplotes crassus]